jgi:hypothetical protein
MTDTGYLLDLHNFTTGEHDQLEAIGGSLYRVSDPPRRQVNLAEYVPQDNVAQNLLKTYLARQYGAGTPRVPRTPIELLVAVLEHTAHRPVPEGNNEQLVLPVG